jgi:hypothetical protein
MTGAESMEALTKDATGNWVDFGKRRSSPPAPRHRRWPG